MKRQTRREFIRATSLAAASTSLLPALTGCKSVPQNVHAKVRGANEVIRVAVVGFNDRGNSHIKAFSGLPGVRLVALCDVDRAVLDRGVAKLKTDGVTVQGFTDIRKLLEQPDIDAVSVATPNHWHSLAAIWAVQAGKDVYVEKPLSHNVWEGRQLVLAARKHERIVQTGSQIRSSEGVREAMAWIHAGKLGDITRARGFCYKRRASIGKADAPLVIPESVDFDLWCGPAPKEPIHRKRLHYDWHWVWPTGNGDLGNQGVHQMDLCRWAIEARGLPPRVLSIGGRFGYEDDGTTPNTQIVLHDYEPAPILFEVRGLPSGRGSAKPANMDKYLSVEIGVVIDCEHGWLEIPSYSTAIAYDAEGKEIKRFNGGGDHFANFIKAVRSRKTSDLNANAYEGHLSAALCHTANISYRLGQHRSPGETRDYVKSSALLSGAWVRVQEHLNANDVDLEKTPATLGAFLEMDPRTETFKRNPQADAMLTREYREPFVVPSMT